MTETGPSASKRRRPGGLHRFGYALAAAVNLMLLVVVNNLLAWDLLPWLTDDFEQVLPILNLSLVASMAVNLAYIWVDPGGFKPLVQAGLNVINLLVVFRLLRLFPFDFSGYEFDWAILARIVLILAMVGTTIAIIAELAKVLTEQVRRTGEPGSP